jgi:hypothetical protein
MFVLLEKSRSASCTAVVSYGPWAGLVPVGFILCQQRQRPPMLGKSLVVNSDRRICFAHYFGSAAALSCSGPAFVYAGHG